MAHSCTRLKMLQCTAPQRGYWENRRYFNTENDSKAKRQHHHNSCAFWMLFLKVTFTYGYLVSHTVAKNALLMEERLSRTVRVLDKTEI